MSELPTPSINAPDSAQELATLIRALQVISRNGRLAQVTLSQLLGRSVFEPTFVEDIALTPDEVEAAFATQAEAQSYWVVIRGREPGLYTTVVAANDQTNGVPNQLQIRQTGLAAALALYRAHYAEPDQVKKLVEEVAAPVAPSGWQLVL
ncbi:hypothetical protein DFH06DRAFT_1131425 [Mycena polygramma]|nr:hypothetical protein DFH06DRAFT_1147898 [Mycena polygramma]KAJ7657643.1 hypothetical protein DFH06DRAFT_1131425 [Mycena polygramma]